MSFFYFFKFLREVVWKNSKTKNGPMQGTFPYTLDKFVILWNKKIHISYSKEIIFLALDYIPAKKWI